MEFSLRVQFHLGHVLLELLHSSVGGFCLLQLGSGGQCPRVSVYGQDFLPRHLDFLEESGRHVAHCVKSGDHRRDFVVLEVHMGRDIVNAFAAFVGGGLEEDLLCADLFLHPSLLRLKRVEELGLL